MTEPDSCIEVANSVSQINVETGANDVQVVVRDGGDVSSNINVKRPESGLLAPVQRSTV